MDRRDWIGWAFNARHPHQDGGPDGEALNAGEKLVLVYLASLAGAEGVGRLDREDLARVTDYEPRSLQRILKALRDADLLHQTDSGWYGLGSAAHLQTLPSPELLEVALSRPGRIIAVEAQAPLLGQDELEAAGETIAKHVDDAADRMLHRLNDSSLRLLGGMERLVLSLDGPADPPPPPDPVLTHPLYQQLLELGIDQDVAYAQVEKRLASAQDPLPTLIPDMAARLSTPAQAEAHLRKTAPQLFRDPPPPPPRLNTARFLETPRARFEFVWNLLHEKPPTDAAAEELFQVWQQLEDQENKHSVAGETVSAFEQLFPAIVAAAEREKGRMPMREFIDLGNATRGAAPWDKPAAGGQLSTSEMDREISRMVQEIERANHPTIQIGPPTTEKDDDTGATRTESTLSYFLRVKRVHQQLLQWRQMTE